MSAIVLAAYYVKELCVFVGLCVCVCLLIDFIISYWFKLTLTCACIGQSVYTYKISVNSRVWWWWLLFSCISVKGEQYWYKYVPEKKTVSVFSLACSVSAILILMFCCCQRAILIC